MSFKLLGKTDAKKVWWPVQIQEPLDGGRSRIHKVEIEYEVVNQDTLDDLTAINDLAVLRRVITGWKGFQDDSGAELPCDDDNKEAAVQVPYVRSALLQGYFMAATGGRRKN